MSLASNRALLVTLSKDLALRFEETKGLWKDVKAHEFERQFIQELLSGVDKAVEVIEKLDKILSKARSDCE